MSVSPRTASPATAPIKPRTSAQYRPMLDTDPNRILDRLNRIAEELRMREHGYPSHYSHITEGESIPDIANDAVVLALAYADALDRRYPRHG